jgi:hypothetical protein
MSFIFFSLHIQFPKQSFSFKIHFQRNSKSNFFFLFNSPHTLERLLEKAYRSHLKLKGFMFFKYQKKN